MGEATIGALSAVVVALLAAVVNAYRNRADGQGVLSASYSKLVADLQADNALLRAQVADLMLEVAKLKARLEELHDE